MHISNTNFSLSELALPVVVLIGPPGGGKTEVGTLLARDLGWIFWDTDGLIEQATGLTISEIFTQFGEETFRLLEKQLVGVIAKLSKVARETGNKGTQQSSPSNTISYPESTKKHGTVISTGGGLPVPEVNFAALSKIGTTISLYAQPDILFERINGKGNRPLLNTPNSAVKSSLSQLKQSINKELDQERRHRLVSLVQERTHIYAKANIGIDTSNLNINAVVENIKSKLLST